MSAPTPTMEFQFVNSTLSSPTVPQDVAVRAMIRKQAMKKASAARKRDGNYGKHNLRQFPIFIYDQDNVAREPTAVEVRNDAAKTTCDLPQPLRATDTGHVRGKDDKLIQIKKERGSADRQRWLAKMALAESLSVGMSAKGYQLTSIKTDFNILDLSTLATLHVGRATRAALSQNPDHLIHQLRSNYDPQWSYLSFLPSRYGEIGCLSDAADCVIARARYTVCPNKNWEAAVITFYVKALTSLQKALDCPKQRYKPEVLCATEILALYELLDPHGETAWVRHTAGAARLIQVRGPKSYNTEFEKSLFMAHTVPIITECLFNGEHCFLEQEQWQRVFVASIKESTILTDRSEIVMRLLMLKCFIPGKFTDVTSIICKPGQPDNPATSDVTTKLQNLRTDLLKWYGRYESILKSQSTVPPGSMEYDSHCKVFATYLCCLIISTRLLAALSSADRSELENTSLVLSGQMFQLEREVRDVSLQTSLFMAQTLGIAQSIMATTEDWTGHSIDDKEYSSGIIARWKFEKWNNICGRKLP